MVGSRGAKAQTVTDFRQSRSKATLLHELGNEFQKIAFSFVDDKSHSNLYYWLFFG
jgi:hypothetical protein